MNPAAADDGRAPSERQAALAALFEALHAEPHAHDFFALLRRIESLVPESPRFGRAARPAQEPLRLGQEPELDFAPAALASFEPAARVPRLGVRFFGLLGPQGPMPLHFTEYVRERQRQRGDPTLARFLDVFHHRLLSLFYRAWAQAQPSVHCDRPHDDRYADWLGSCFGQGAASPRDSIRPQSRLFQAGLLAMRSRHAEGLIKLLSMHFDVPVRIVPNVPQWMELEQEDRSRLGHARSRPERSRVAAAQLGACASVGHKVRDRQYKFRIVLGPLSLARYEAFLPGGPAWRELHDWVRSYAGPGLAWDAELSLARRELPEPLLGRYVRLGLTSWAGRRRTPRDTHELHIRPQTSFIVRRQGVDHHG